MDVIGVDLYDEAIYGDSAYNEALAADLFSFDEYAGRRDHHNFFPSKTASFRMKLAPRNQST